MANTLKDLNNSLFAQLNRIIEAQDEKSLEKETKKAKICVEVSKTIIDNARLVLDAQKYATDFGIDSDAPDMLMIDSKNKSRK